MEKEQLKLIIKEYKEKEKERKELIKLLNTKSVNRYIEMMGLEKTMPSLQEDIMGNILEKYKLKSEKEIVFYEGIYLITDEDSIFENHELLQESDIERTEEKIENDWIKYRDAYITRYYYDLISGEELYGKYDKTITLPSVKRIINLSEEDEEIKKSEIYDYYEDYSLAVYRVLRNQFFIMLSNNSYKSVMDYYTDDSNLDEIDERVENYFKQKKLRYK